MKTLRALFSTMRRAARLDVYALNDLLSSERFRWAEVHPAYKPRGVPYCILKFFYKLLKSTKTLGRTAALARSMPPGAVLAFVTTSNQWDAIRPVTDRLDEAVVVGAVYVEGDAPYPLGSAFLYALPFFPIVFFHYLKAKGYKRLSHRAAFHEYWAAYGHYVVAVRLLRRLAPSAVLVANDHVMWTRTLVQAAREQGIPTCYLQHASVTENFPPLSFDYAFLDEAIDRRYRTEQNWTRIFTTAAFLAILIACLGLFGLSALTAERRTKEIGVRKVLGASVSRIVLLLSKDFLTLVGIAFVIAAPLAYLAVEAILQDFAYRIDLSWQIFLIAGLTALLVALLKVSFQSIKAAGTNPVKTLRYE